MTAPAGLRRRTLPGLDTLTRTASSITRSATSLFGGGEELSELQPVGKLPEWKVMCLEAEALAKAGEKEEALMLYHKALRMRPNAQEIKKAIKALSNSIAEKLQSNRTTKLFATMKLLAHKKKARKRSLTGTDTLLEISEDYMTTREHSNLAPVQPIAVTLSAKRAHRVPSLLQKETTLPPIDDKFARRPDEEFPRDRKVRNGTVIGKQADKVKKDKPLPFERPTHVVNPPGLLARTAIPPIATLNLEQTEKEVKTLTLFASHRTYGSKTSLISPRSATSSISRRSSGSSIPPLIFSSHEKPILSRSRENLDTEPTINNVKDDKTKEEEALKSEDKVNISEEGRISIVDNDVNNERHDLMAPSKDDEVPPVEIKITVSSEADPLESKPEVIPSEQAENKDTEQKITDKSNTETAEPESSPSKADKDMNPSESTSPRSQDYKESFENGNSGPVEIDENTPAVAVHVDSNNNGESNDSKKNRPSTDEEIIPCVQTANVPKGKDELSPTNDIIVKQEPVELSSSLNQDEQHPSAQNTQLKLTQQTPEIKPKPKPKFQRSMTTIANGSSGLGEPKATKTVKEPNRPSSAKPEKKNSVKLKPKASTGAKTKYDLPMGLSLKKGKASLRPRSVKISSTSIQKTSAMKTTKEKDSPKTTSAQIGKQIKKKETQGGGLGNAKNNNTSTIESSVNKNDISKEKSEPAESKPTKAESKPPKSPSPQRSNRIDEDPIRKSVLKSKRESNALRESAVQSSQRNNKKGMSVTRGGGGGRKFELQMKLEAAEENETPQGDSRNHDWRQEAPEFLLESTQTLESPRSSSPDSSPQQYALTELKRIQNDYDEDRYEQAKYRCKQVIQRITETEVSDAFTENEKQNILANLHSCKGNAALEMGLMEEALGCHLKDLRTAEDHGLLDAKSRALANVGRVHARAGRFRDAIDVWKDKVSLCASSEERAWLFHEMGRCYYEMMDYNDALDYADKSWVNAQETDDSDMQFKASYLMAQCYDKLQALEEALVEYKKALDLANVSDNEDEAERIQEALQRLSQKLAGNLAAKRERTRARLTRSHTENELIPLSARDIDGDGKRSSPATDTYYLTLLYVMASLPEY